MEGPTTTTTQPGRLLFDVPLVGTAEQQRLEFRVPDLEDMAALDQALPLLPDDDELEEEIDAGRGGTEVLQQIMADPGRAQRYMQRANRMLVRCCVSHQLELETIKGEAEPGQLEVRAIPSQDRVALYLMLTGAAGFTQEAAVQLAGFPEPSSSSAIESPNGTESRRTEPLGEGTQGGADCSD